MISRYSVSLNDVLMSDLNPNLLVLDVNYADPSYEIDSTTVGGRDGAYILNKTKEAASVTITFELHIYGIAERQQACQAVNAWARNGGILRINDRPDQRLECICTKLASIASARNWTDPLSISFAAYRVPYWEDEEQAVISLYGRTASGSLNIPGNGKEAYVSCEITARASLSSIRVNVGSTYIELRDISLPADGQITIDYVGGVLAIRQGQTSILGRRTGASSDDLKADCGASCAVSYVASAQAAVTFRTRGCWT